jgi:uncharacterized glyoxalase superfamily protein PhnB
VAKLAERNCEMKYIISNAGLLVQNVKQVVRYYCDTFGYALKQDFPEFVEFEANGGASLFLWQWSYLEHIIGSDAMAKVKYPFMAAIQYQTEEEVVEAYLDLMLKGVDFVSPPANRSWNAYAAYFVDVEGYIWELYAWQEPTKTAVGSIE